jgi:hypothetical protein
MSERVLRSQVSEDFSKGHGPDLDPDLHLRRSYHEMLCGYFGPRTCCASHISTSFQG